MDALGLRVVAPRREQGVRGVIARARSRGECMHVFEKHETLVERSLKIYKYFPRFRTKSRSARTAVVAPEARARGAFQRVVGVFQPPRRRARRFRP
jgi:hypothetical protein